MRSSASRLAFLVALTFCTQFAFSGERINHEGRILPDLPAISAPILFNTPQADAVIAAMQVFPTTSAWNEDISKRPLLTNSAAMIAQIKSELLASRQTLRPFYEMNFVIVPPAQPKVTVIFDLYPGESDPSPYPFNSLTPIEGWPLSPAGSTLSQVQTTDDGSDRHAIIIDPVNGTVWETWRTVLTAGTWHAANGAKFDLNSNTLRPLGWTSADAAGLSMLAGLVRYDECERGVVEHAIRLIVAHTRREYIYPATHFASSPSTTDPNVPAMGQRLRLRSSFVVPATWTKQEKAVAAALKKYGAIVADNGNFFSISVAPDNRFPANAFSNLQTIDINNFEVIQTTLQNEGPRSPGAPTANAGADRTIGIAFPANLNGVITGSNLTVAWKMYSGPGAVTFSNAAAAATTATFSALGSYILMLSADDGVHSIAYDAVVVNVTSGGGPDTNPLPGGTGGGTGGPGGLGGAGSDTDGDGFSDELEVALGTSPTDPTSTPFGGARAGTVQPLDVLKLSTKLDFARTARDSVSLSGTLPVPDGFSSAAKQLVIDVGGVIAQFTLDAKGKALSAAGSAKVMIKAKKGVVAAQTAKYQIKLMKGSEFAKKLSDEGMAGAEDATNAPREVRVTVLFNNTMYQKLQPQLWTCKAGKSGRSK